MTLSSPRGRQTIDTVAESNKNITVTNEASSAYSEEKQSSRGLRVDASLQSLNQEGDDEVASLPSPAHSHVLYDSNGSLSLDSLTFIDWTRGNVLGEGAYGKVYLGLNVQTGELLAAKQIKLANVESKETKKFVERLQREIRILQTLSHPHIVRYLGAQVETDPESDGGECGIECVRYFSRLFLHHSFSRSLPLSLSIP
jgi:hypothetical protein